MKSPFRFRHGRVNLPSLMNTRSHVFQSAVFWLLLFLAGLYFETQCEAADRTEAERFFESGLIPHIEIEIAQTNLNRLRRYPREYVRATIREGGKVYEEVGIHLKGAAGSFRPIDDAKPAFTLNF